MIVRRLTQMPDIYLYEMVRDEFGIDPREAEDRGLRAPLAISGSYALGALLPIVAFMLPLSMRVSTVASLTFALFGLFAVGYYAEPFRNAVRSARVWKSRSTGAPSLRSPILSGTSFHRSSGTRRFRSAFDGRRSRSDRGIRGRGGVPMG